MSDLESRKNKVCKFLKARQCTTEAREIIELVEKNNKSRGSIHARYTHKVGKLSAENGVRKIHVAGR